MIYQTKKKDSKNITDLTRSLLVALKCPWQNGVAEREIQNKPFKSAKIISSPRIDGLHHVYKWDKAA